jgi:outer membrane receptor protein involved in Fe transport
MNFPTDSYFLKTNAKDEQYAVFGEADYHFTERWKGTLGARWSHNKFSFDTFTGGPQLFGPSATGAGNNSENSFTPKVGVQFQADPSNMYYATYAKGFRPGGANNPLPAVACAPDFTAFGITAAPTQFSSDTVDSYEIGAKNNFSNRVKVASSIYYIRWNNIQQTVVPPVCQISFIDNLGEAAAKGIDLQAEIAATSNLSLELAAGYTSARYTKDSTLSASSTTGPVVANGNAITAAASETGGGQPTAPWTVTAGLEYRFGVVSHQAFVRADYTYDARAKWLTPGQDASTLQYDQASFVTPGTAFTTLRGGMEFGSWSVSAFIENLTNTLPITDFNNTICPVPSPRPAGTCDAASGTRLLREYSFRPRTFGITAIFRQ